MEIKEYSILKFLNKCNEEFTSVIEFVIPLSQHFFCMSIYV